MCRYTRPVIKLGLRHPSKKEKKIRAREAVVDGSEGGGVERE